MHEILRMIELAASAMACFTDDASAIMSVPHRVAAMTLTPVNLRS
jgi:hypothetical protein